MKFICLILLNIPVLLFADVSIDSLERELNSVAGEARVDVLNELARINLDSSLEKSFKYSKKAILLAYKLNYISGIANAKLYYGLYYFKLGEYEKSLQHILIALENFEELDVKYKIAYSSITIGTILYKMENFKTALIYYKKAIKIYRYISKSDLLALSLNSVGTIHYKLSNYDSTLKYHAEAMDIYKGMDKEREIASTMYSIGAGFSALCLYDRSIEYYLKSLRIFESIEDNEGIFMIYHAIGEVYLDMKNFKKALFYNREAIKLIKRIDNKELVTSLFKSLGIVYYYLAEYDSSLYYSKKSLEISKEIIDKTSIVLAYNTRGDVYYKLGDYNKALCCYLQAKDFIQLDRNKWLSAKTHGNIGKIYTKLKEYDKAYKNLKISLKFSRIIKTKDLIQDSYKYLSEYYKVLDHPERAYYYLKRFSDLKDSVFTESSHRIAEMQTRYEMDKREKENEILRHNNSIQKLELERQNLTKWRLYFGLAIISILVFFIYYRYRVKLAINMELEKRINTAMKKNKEQQQIIFHQASLTSLGELAAGMAHEINQPLQNIYLATETLEFELRENNPNQSIIVTNVKDISCNLMRMRKIVDHIRVFSSKQKDEVYNDFNVKEYIDKAFLLVKKQYLKNGVKIYFDISDDKILLRGNPYKYEQIILNLLSNSRDAVIEKSKIAENEFSKEIHIKIYQNENETITIVKDNGIGMLPEKITEVFVPFYTTKKLGRGSGLGMPITRNIIHEMQGSIKIESKRNEGTTVIIKFPQIIND